MKHYNPFTAIGLSIRRYTRDNTLTVTGWLLIALLVYGFVFTISTESSQDVNAEAKAPVKAAQSLPEPSQKTVQAPITGLKGVMAHVTAFSSVECKTSWCNRKEPKDGQIALSKSFGKICKVYIPAFDRTYRVVGGTDSKTQADIWFGDDQEAAKQFGSKTLLINPIPCS